MVTVVRLKYDDLIPRIQQGQADTIEHTGGSGADNNFFFRINLNSRKAQLLFSDGLAQLRQTIIARVDIDAAIHGLFGAGQNLRRHLQITHPLGHVDPAHPVTFDGHVANFGLDHPFTPLAEFKAHFFIPPDNLYRFS